MAINLKDLYDIYGGDPTYLSAVKGNTPFEYYTNDPEFTTDALSVARFVAQRLGVTGTTTNSTTGLCNSSPIVLNITDLTVYAAFEEAVTTYGNLVYQYKIRDQYINMEGSETLPFFHNTITYVNSNDVGSPITWSSARLANWNEIGNESSLSSSIVNNKIYTISASVADFVNPDLNFIKSFNLADNYTSGSTNYNLSTFVYNQFNKISGSYIYLYTTNNQIAGGTSFFGANPIPTVYIQSNLKHALNNKLLSNNLATITTRIAEDYASEAGVGGHYSVKSGSFAPASASILASGSNVAFTLKTISEGTIMNNSGSLGTNGILSSGSADNVRWQIANRDTGSGTFSLLIRQGNDTTTEPVVLETWTNLSLDPTQPNYIARVIGDSYQSYNSSENYIQVNGTFPNQSRYVYISAVNNPTPYYFDNNGTAKALYTSSIPLNASGAFNNATGDLFYGGGAKYYSAISGTANIQGISASNYDNMINLMANQDDYRFNSITIPGLTIADNSTQVTNLANNVQSRGDAILVADTRPYGAQLSQTITSATSINNSYVATYWPWLQTIDPGTGQLVWVPASTMIPGVYAFNDSVSEPWFAPAGINRGGLSTVVRAERKLSQTAKSPA